MPGRSLLTQGVRLVSTRPEGLGTAPLIRWSSDGSCICGRGGRGQCSSHGPQLSLRSTRLVVIASQLTNARRSHAELFGDESCRNALRAGVPDRSKDSVLNDHIQAVAKPTQLSQLLEGLSGLKLAGKNGEDVEMGGKALCGTGVTEKLGTIVSQVSHLARRVFVSAAFAEFGTSVHGC